MVTSKNQGQPQKDKAISGISIPKTLKDMQSLSGKLDSLSVPGQRKLFRDGQDDVRLCLGDDLKKAQDHSQRQAGDLP
ncbi:hypothetical protein Tco_1446564 [Tanacetum coccineum]